MLMNEQHVMLKACIDVRLKSQLRDDRVMMTVHMSIYPVQTFEHLSNECWVRLGKRYAYLGREDLLVVDAALTPGHQVLDILRRRHLRGSFVVLRVLP